MENLEQKLAFYKIEWEREKARRELVEQQIHLAEQELSGAMNRSATLGQRLSSLEKQLANTLKEVGELQQTRDKLLEQNAKMFALQQDFMARMGHEHVWKRDFLEPLADEMAALEDAIGLIESPKDWITLFEIWQREILDGLEQLLNGVDDEQLQEGLRRRVLAQWVFMRWLEIHNFVRVQP